MLGVSQFYFLLLDEVTLLLLGILDQIVYNLHLDVEEFSYLYASSGFRCCELRYA